MIMQVTLYWFMFYFNILHTYNITTITIDPLFLFLCVLSFLEFLLPRPFLHNSFLSWYQTLCQCLLQCTNQFGPWFFNPDWNPERTHIGLRLTSFCDRTPLMVVFLPSRMKNFWPLRTTIGRPQNDVCLQWLARHDEV